MPSRKETTTQQLYGGGRDEDRVMQQPRDIVEPQENDVLCGRGARINNHVGNQRFREMVDEAKERYWNSSPQDKKPIPLEIVEAVRALDPPGRFLEESTGSWYEVRDKKAREKVRQALTEGQAAARARQEGRDTEKAAKNGRRFSFSAHENNIIYVPVPSEKGAFVKNKGGETFQEWIEELRKTFRTISWMGEETRRSMVKDAVKDMRKNKNLKFIKSWTLEDSQNVMYQYAKSEGNIPFVDAADIVQVKSGPMEENNNNEGNKEDEISDSSLDDGNVSHSGRFSMVQLSEQMSWFEAIFSQLTSYAKDVSVYSTGVMEQSVGTYSCGEVVG